MRYTLKDQNGLLDVGGTVASLGLEVYKQKLAKTNVCALQKISKLEDIEEELGIDLVTLLKAVKNGIWIKRDFGFHVVIDYSPFRISYWEDNSTGEKGMYVCGMDIKDYGKTWALTREELENCSGSESK